MSSAGGSRPTRSLWRWGVQRFREVVQEPGADGLRRFAGVARECSTVLGRFRTLSDAELDERVASLAERRLDVPGASEIEVLAVVSEVARRVLDLEPFDVQLLAAVGMIHERVVDMATGEGKTLVGFLVAGSLALSGRRVHVLSANDYLARRDARVSTEFFSRLGLSIAVVTEALSDSDKREAYSADVVYATVHQVGFDLLRDRQRGEDSDRVAAALDAAVIDEIDAVLLDDATVPLVLAGDAPPITITRSITDVIATLTPIDHYSVDGERHSASFTESGIAVIEAALGITNLYSDADLVSAAHVALHAYALVTRGVDYVVTDGRIELINEARGRVAVHQRWPDGLQAAVELKEGLAATAHAQIRDQTLVETVVRGYTFVTGMSGSAVEAAERLSDDLGITTGAVPPNRPRIRVDEPDRLYLTEAERNAAAVARIVAAHEAGQPVLIGTHSVNHSEQVAALLAAAGIDPVVLNAANDADEARVVALAGLSGSVTVSTQMAGRGVDIRLDDAARSAGGLLVLGLGRYRSVRLDHQLRGRSGRQGDPGRSAFYTSMADAVVTEHLVVNTTPRSMDDDGLILDTRFAKLYDHAQRIAEGKAMQLHRTTREYQRVLDDHRRVVLELRDDVVARDEAIARYLGRLWPDDSAERWERGPRRELARAVILFHLDQAWADQLSLLAEVREGIHLRALARQSPLDEFILIAGDEFASFFERVGAAVRSTLDDAGSDAVSLDDLGLQRPSSTWTYLVTDNPFGSEVDRIVAVAKRTLRGGRRPDVEYL